MKDELQAVFTADTIDNILVLQDLAEHYPGAKSITNDAEQVVYWAFNKSSYAGRFDRILYKDTRGIWDELVVENGEFAGFGSIGETGLGAAIQKLYA